MRLLYYLLLCIGLSALCSSGTVANDRVEPKVVMASLQPVNGCNSPSEPWLKSGCLEVPKPMDRFYEPCGGDYECPIAYKAKHTNWGRIPTLPPITVTAPKRRNKTGHVPSAIASNTGAIVRGQSTGPTSPSSPSVGEQIARQGMVMGAQMGGAALGGLAGPAGALVGGWLGCTFSVYGIVQKDFAKIERWDLHPELARANFSHSLIGCSVIGFLQRAKEAPTERDRAFALLQGLAMVPSPYVSLVGQLAPAANALLSKGSAVAATGKGSGKFLGVWQSSKPYHNGEPWAANSPG